MRGKKAKPREIKPDHLHKSVLVQKFINKVMKDGKKNIAAKLVYDAIDELAKKTKKDALEAFEEAINNIKPKVEVRSRRVGGANYQVPVPVDEKRQESLAIRWILKAARDARKKSDFAQALADTLVASINKEGPAYKKREDTHKMAEANKAFAQFAW